MTSQIVNRFTRILLGQSGFIGRRSIIFHAGGLKSDFIEVCKIMKGIDRVNAPNPLLTIG